MRLRTILLITLFDIANSYAKDLGTVSTTLSIKEQSLIEIIQKKLGIMESNGELEKHQKEIQKRAVARVERPQAMDGLSNSVSYSAKLYDPSVSLPEDIKDHQGKTIIKKGTIYNPLKDTSFGAPLLFIDGDDKEQVLWAQAQKGKIVLVKGEPLKLTREFKTHFYFDQGGTLVQKLGIKDIPTKVSQKGQRLLIEAIPVSNRGPER